MNIKYVVIVQIIKQNLKQWNLKDCDYGNNNDNNVDLITVLEYYSNDTNRFNFTKMKVLYILLDDDYVHRIHHNHDHHNPIILLAEDHHWIIIIGTTSKASTFKY